MKKSDEPIAVKDCLISINVDSKLILVHSEVSPFSNSIVKLNGWRKTKLILTIDTGMIIVVYDDYSTEVLYGFALRIKDFMFPLIKATDEDVAEIFLELNNRYQNVK